MLQVLLTEYRLLHRYAPINAKRLVLDIDAAISLRMIELVAFVLEDGGFGENGKAMGKTTRDEKLTIIASVVFEYTGLNYEHAGDICLNYIHDD